MPVELTEMVVEELATYSPPIVLDKALKIIALEDEDGLTMELHLQRQLYSSYVAAISIKSCP